MSKNCRMEYDPKVCTKHYQGFTTKELSYMCYWYGQISSREIAIALGRTQKSILNKALKLKNSGQFEIYRKKYDHSS